jgi:hypothetical protein
VEWEQQRVLAVPPAFIATREACVEKVDGRPIRRGRLGLPSRRQVEPRQVQPLVVRDNQSTTDVQMVRNLEQPIVGYVTAAFRPQMAADAEMHGGALWLRNERVCRLLDSVVDEREHAIRGAPGPIRFVLAVCRANQAGVERLRETACRALGVERRCGEKRLPLERAADASGEPKHILRD